MSAAFVTYHSADVAMYFENEGAGGGDAFVYCVDEVPGRPNQCAHWHLVVNSYFGHAEGDERKSIMCHELGHTVGLKDTTPSTTCMREGSVYPLHFDSHDVSQINSHY